MRHERRTFLLQMLQWGTVAFAACVGLSWLAGCSRASAQRRRAGTAPSIDQRKCRHCGVCAGACAHRPIPAMQAVNDPDACAYCIHCFGYTRDQDGEGVQSGLICPYDALRRTKLAETMYEYVVDTARCQGCAACVLECHTLGKGSLTLRVNDDLCLHCHHCTAQQACPHGAMTRTTHG